MIWVHPTTDVLVRRCAHQGDDTKREAEAGIMQPPARKSLELQEGGKGKGESESLCRKCGPRDTLVLTSGLWNSEKIRFCFKPPCLW